MELAQLESGISHPHGPQSLAKVGCLEGGARPSRCLRARASSMISRGGSCGSAANTQAAGPQGQRAARGQGDLGGGPGRGTWAASSCVVGARALLTTGIFLQNTKSMHLHCVFHGRWETSTLGKRQTLKSHPGQETGACRSFLITDKGPWACAPHSAKAHGHMHPTGQRPAVKWTPLDKGPRAHEPHSRV